MVKATGGSQGQQQLEEEQGEAAEISPLATEQPEEDQEDQADVAGKVVERAGNRIDWIAIAIVALVAAFFAVVARFNLQPPTSLTPIAVLSATGCGLLITALRKQRTARGPGLLEAAIAGFFLALFPFLAAITAPGVLSVLSTSVDDLHGFLTTWALILVFSLLFSIIGATLGHLAFAPLRPLPAKAQKGAPVPEGEMETEEGEDEIAPAEGSGEALADEEAVPAVEAQRSLFSYLVAALLLGLMPTIAGYVFSAAFDFMLKLYTFFPGPYPTLRLLSGLLPWQVPVSLNLSNGPQNAIFLEWQFWRIPVFLGNPTMFDLVALEPYLLNAAALALLLFSVHRFAGHSWDESPVSRWPVYLLLEVLLGLVIVLPAALWVMRGLEGLLQMPGLVIPIRALYLLNPLTFTLNLVTGPLVCLLVAILLRLFLMRRRVA